MTTITLPRAVVEQALEALDEADTFHRNLPDQRARRLAAMAALRSALAQQAEPVQPFGYWFSDKHQDAVCSGWFVRSPCDGKLDGKPGVPLYTAPPQREPLTEKEMYIVEEEARKNFRLAQSGPRGQMITYWDSLTPWLIRAVERAHGIKE